MWTIIGQERAVSLLQRGIETESLSHAYIFVGPPRAGKMTLAVNLAQALNCESDSRPCGECLSCRKIASGGHSDVQVIRLESGGENGEARQKTEISIERIREIQRSASLPPFEGRFRIYIIDEAERMSLEAANCLLKTLEEPEAKVAFVLLTRNAGLLPETVVSRCQRVDLPPVPLPQIETALKERFALEAEKAALLARLSHGCPGWAVAAAADDSLLARRDELLDKIIDIIRGDLEERFAYAGQLAAQFARDREAVQEKLDALLDWWRDLLLMKTGLVNNIGNTDRMDNISEMAAGYSLPEIRDFIGGIRSAGEQLRQNANARLVLEVLMLDMPEIKTPGGAGAAVG